MAVVCGAVGQPTKTAPAPHTPTAALLHLCRAGRCGAVPPALACSPPMVSPSPLRLLSLTRPLALARRPFLRASPKGLSSDSRLPLRRLPPCTAL